MSETIQVPKNEYNEMKKLWDKSQNRFSSTKFFKRRILLTLLLIFLVIGLTPFAETQESTLDPIGLLISLTFIGLLMIVDQLVFGLYYYTREIK